MWLAQCVAMGETGEAGEEKQKEDQRDNLGPTVNHNNCNCEPFMEHLLCDRYCTDTLQTFL